MAKKSIFANPRSKKIVIISTAMSAVVLISMLLISNDDVSNPSKVVRAERVSATPGGNSTPRYQQQVKEKNAERARLADESGDSAIPTIFDPGSKNKSFDLEEDHGNEPVNAEQVAYQTSERRNKQYQAPVLVDPNMAKQMMRLATVWGNNGPGESIQFNTALPSDIVKARAEAEASKNAAQNATSTVAKSAETEKLPLLYRAGEFIPAQTDMLVNSDYPKPGVIRLTITSGPLKDAYALAKFEKQGEDSIVLAANSLSIEGIGTVPIDAFAVNETGNYGLATDVDYHRLYRYASLASGILVKGMGYYGELSTQENTTINTGLNSGTSIARGKTPTNDKVIASLGKGFSDAMDDAGKSLSDGYNRESTVTYKQGSPVYLLVLKDIRMKL